MIKYPVAAYTVSTLCVLPILKLVCGVLVGKGLDPLPLSMPVLLTQKSVAELHSVEPGPLHLLLGILQVNIVGILNWNHFVGL